MKKRLLSVSVMFLAAAGSFAQGWTLPEVPGSDLVPGEKVFLYNKQAGAFFSGLGVANDGVYWGTRVGVTIEGADTVVIQPALLENVKEGSVPEDGNVVFPSEWDGETYLIQNYLDQKSTPRWDEVWYGLMDYSDIWTDRQNNVRDNENFFWNVIKNANGNYEISASKKSAWLADNDLYASLTELDSLGNVAKAPVLVGGERLGIDVSDPDLAAHFEGFANGTLAYEWVIVKLEDFEKLNLEDFVRYNAAMSLKALLDVKKAEFPEVDFSSAEAYYNNTSSTTEELQAAKDIINKLILDWEASQATPDNPRVLSSAIVNPTFDEIGDFTGWSGTKFGAGGQISTNAEHYEKNFNTYQDIKTDLPIGIYKVGVKGFYRAGNKEADWKTKDDPTVRHASLYAVSGADSLYAAIPSLSSVATEFPVDGADYAEVIDGNFLPATMVDFTAYKDAGVVKEVSVLLPVSNNRLRIGVVKNTTIAADWAIFDDFTLEYYGPSLEAYELWRDQVLAAMPSMDEIVTEETLYNSVYSSAFENAVETAKQASDIETITSVIKKVAPALDSLQANIQAYKAYKETYDAADAFLANEGNNLDPDADSVILLQDYIQGEYEPGEDCPYPNGSASYIMGYDEPGACTLTTAQVYEEIAYLKKMVQAATKCTLEGGDVTDLLVNPDFSAGNSGWTMGSGCNPIFDWEEVEVFGERDGHVDIYQTITGVKPGIYSISVQGFERHDWPDNMTGKEEPQVFLYMGDIETPVQNITEDLIAEEDAVAGKNHHSSDDLWDDGTLKGYMPSGMEGAAVAFSAGRYTQECYGIVGEDGVMKVGLTSHGVRPHWVLVDNFKLKFWGKSTDALAEVLEAKYAEGESYLSDNYGQITNPAYEGVNSALINFEEVVDSEDYDAMYAALNAYSKAMADAKTNREVMNKLNEALDEIETAFYAYEETALESALNAAFSVMERASEEVLMELTTDELNVLLADAKLAAELLPYNDYYIADMERLPELPTEPEQYPFDMAGFLRNGEFANNAEFWTITSTVKSADKGEMREFWDPSSVNMQFDVQQSLYALPEGKYTLTADVVNSVWQQSVGTNGGRVHLYADVVNIATGDTVTTSLVIEPLNEETIQTSSYVMEFNVPAHKEYQKVVLGLRSVGVLDANWVVYDNFVLKYLGESDEVSIEGVENNSAIATPVAIYNISGARVGNLTKGVNIVKMSDGTVKKVVIR